MEYKVYVRNIHKQTKKSFFLPPSDGEGTQGWGLGSPGAPQAALGALSFTASTGSNNC